MKSLSKIQDAALGLVSQVRGYCIALAKQTTRFRQEGFKIL